jgi:very-short-patch-repair endonuclease
MSKIEPIKKEFARGLRKEQTKAEEYIWEILRNRQLKGLKFRRQHVIKGFVVDFYCDRLKLAIEVDGKIHDNQKEYDELRQKVIEEYQVEFIRVSNTEVFNDINILLNQIVERM